MKPVFPRGGLSQVPSSEAGMRVRLKLPARGCWEGDLPQSDGYCLVRAGALGMTPIAAAPPVLNTPPSKAPWPLRASVITRLGSPQPHSCSSRPNAGRQWPLALAPSPRGSPASSEGSSFTPKCPRAPASSSSKGSPSQQAGYAGGGGSCIPSGRLLEGAQQDPLAHSRRCSEARPAGSSRGVSTLDARLPWQAVGPVLRARVATGRSDCTAEIIKGPSRGRCGAEPSLPRVA